MNLYDFEGTLKAGKSHEEIIENIDIGGPSMIRYAAKNYKDVTVIVDINDYDMVIEKLKNDELTLEDRKKDYHIKHFQLQLGMMHLYQATLQEK